MGFGFFYKFEKFTDQVRCIVQHSPLANQHATFSLHHEIEEDTRFISLLKLPHAVKYQTLPLFMISAL